MNRIKLAHPIGHNLKFNGKHLAIGGKWYDLWGGNFDGFGVWDSQYYWIDNKYTTYGNNIETDVESSSAPSPGVRTWGYLYIYKKIYTPATRSNDNFVMLEFPFNPYRETRNRSILQNNMDASTLKVGLLRIHVDPPPPEPQYEGQYEWFRDSFSFDITSTPTSVVEKGDDGSGMRYGAGSWSHTLSIPNISYTNTFSYSPGNLKIRLLCDLSTKKTYFKLASTFPNEVVLSDYIDTGFTMPTDESSTYMISVYANGIGIKAPNGSPLDYLLAGYSVGSGTPITLKSYLDIQ